jgi:hypothetical protein
MWTSTGRNRETSAGSIELSPLDVIELEALTNPFCPIAENGGHYRPEDCLPFCTICRDLMIQRGGTA